tara:strand:+ start:1318 stop:1446 length:129 start_codon:yes stop_codon:yes gene_type:complete
MILTIVRLRRVRITAIAPVSKTGALKRLAGSNPAPSAKKSYV